MIANDSPSLFISAGVLKISVAVCNATYANMRCADFTGIGVIAPHRAGTYLVRKCSSQEFSNTLWAAHP